MLEWSDILATHLFSTSIHLKQTRYQTPYVCECNPFVSYCEIQRSRQFSTFHQVIRGRNYVQINRIFSAYFQHLKCWNGRGRIKVLDMMKASTAEKWTSSTWKWASHQQVSLCNDQIQQICVKIKAVICIYKYQELLEQHKEGSGSRETIQEIDPPALQIWPWLSNAHMWASALGALYNTAWARW